MYEDESLHSEVALDEQEQDEPEQLSLIQKFMMGCAVLTLIVPVILLVAIFILLSLAQQA